MISVLKILIKSRNGNLPSGNKNLCRFIPEKAYKISSKV